MIKRLFMLLIVAALSSCAAQKNIPYFQDVESNVEIEQIKGEDITVKPGDILSINVSSKNTELATIFNIRSMSGNSNETLSYTISSNGSIDFPVLGEVQIAGLTKEQITDKIKEELITKKYMNDPVVTVTFENLRFYVLGEVSSPGQYNIDKDQTTILEAISIAGDLTIYGKRDKVFLTRNIGEKRITYQLDIRSKDIYKSPAFYVQQNDMIYVEPNKVRAGQSTINGNTVKSTSFWMSLASFLTTMVLLFAN